MDTSIRAVVDRHALENPACSPGNRYDLAVEEVRVVLSSHRLGAPFTGRWIADHGMLKAPGSSTVTYVGKISPQ
jgi:hypothetical protein